MSESRYMWCSKSYNFYIRNTLHRITYQKIEKHSSYQDQLQINKKDEDILILPFLLLFTR